MKPGECDLFHGTDNIPVNLKPSPMYFAHRIEDSKSYANKVVQYKNTVDLHLIDVMHPSFHADFLARINRSYHKKKEYSQVKGWVLAAFGLPDLLSQTNLTNRLVNGVYPDQHSFTEDQKKQLSLIKSFSPYFQNKHRMSTTKIDTLAVQHLIELYVESSPDGHKCDGYISTAFWPSYHMGGMFHPETCIFNPINKLSIGNVIQIKGGDKKQNRKKSKVIKTRKAPFRGGGEPLYGTDAILAEMKASGDFPCGVDYTEWVAEHGIYNEQSGLR